MNAANLPDPVAWPQVTIKDRTFTFKLTSGTIVRLWQKTGIDIFERPPADPAYDMWQTLVTKLAGMDLEDPERPAIERRAELIRSTVSEARMKWVHPLAVGALPARLKVWAEVLSVLENGTLSVDAILDELDPIDLFAIDTAMAEAIKRVGARISQAAAALHPNATN